MFLKSKKLQLDLLLQHNVFIFSAYLIEWAHCKKLPDVSSFMAHLENNKICSAPHDHSSELLAISILNFCGGLLFHYFFYEWAKVPLSQVVGPRSINIICKDALRLQLNLQS